MKTAPSSEGLRTALNVLDARAQFDGEEHEVYLRTAEYDEDTYYIDICDEHWTAIEVRASGWQRVEQPPVKFRRAMGMQALPEPISGGSFNALRPFLNIDDDGFVLLVAWLVAAMRPRGPYPILVLNGEQGSAKSTCARILRSFIDPSTVSVRTLPREERDLIISANHSHVINFDNISRLPAWLSDALCRIATGGG